MQGPFLRKYGVQTTIDFQLFQPDGVDFETAAVFAAGDVKIMKVEGVEVNTTNLPTDEGQGYSLVLTASEMSAPRIVVYIVDQTATKVWLDTAISINTYGNASAEHALDLDSATVDVGKWSGTAVTLSAGLPDVNSDAVNGQTGGAAGLSNGGKRVIRASVNATPTPTTTVWASDGLVPVGNDGQFVGRVIIFEDGPNEHFATKITAWTASTKTLTVSPACPVAPVSGNFFILL